MRAMFLFPVSLLGLGTAEVESLPSYLHRCAIAHGCSVGQLIIAINRLMPESHLCNSNSGKPKYVKPHELLRSGSTTEIFVKSLTKATGQILSSSVVWIFGNSLGISDKEIVKGFRWCPECLAEFERLGLPAYFKLIWHFSSVKACHIHRTPLLQGCEFCGCDQASYKKNNDIGTCQNCAISLSKRKVAIGERDLTASWEYLGSDIVDMIRDLTSAGDVRVTLGNPYDSLFQLCGYYSRIDRTDVLEAVVGRDELMKLICRVKKIDLLTARRLAFGFGVPLSAFIVGEASLTSGVLDHGIFCTLPEGYLDVKHKEPKNHEAIIANVKEVLKTSNTPLSLKGLCEEVGVSTGYLAHRYPTLCKSIVYKHIAHEEELRLKVRYRAQAAALSYFISDKYDPVIKSRNHAYKTLRKEMGLPKKVLEQAIEVAYRALN